MREVTFGWPTEMIVKAARRAGRSKVSGTSKGTVLAG
jgi:hypothetical protein